MKRGASRIGAREAGRVEGTRTEKVRSGWQRSGGREQRSGGMLIWLGRCAARRSLLRLTGRCWRGAAAPAREARDDLDRAWRVTGPRERALAQWRSVGRAPQRRALRCAFDNVIAQRDRFALRNCAFPRKKDGVSFRFRERGISSL